jgi:hypothetical protein
VLVEGEESGECCGRRAAIEELLRVHLAIEKHLLLAIEMQGESDNTGNLLVEGELEDSPAGLRRRDVSAVKEPTNLVWVTRRCLTFMSTVEDTHLAQYQKRPHTVSVMALIRVSIMSEARNTKCL